MELGNQHSSCHCTTEHIRLDPYIWLDHSIEAGDTGCMLMEDPDVGDLLEDLQPYMAVWAARSVFL